MVAARWTRSACVVIGVLSLATLGAACGDDNDSADSKKVSTTTAAESETSSVTAVPGGAEAIDQELSGLDDELGAIDGELSDLEQGVSAQGGIGR